MRIEQYPDQLDKLRVISPEHGANYSSPPVFVGTPDSIKLLNIEGVDLVEVKTGFGEFMMRKRIRGGVPFWSGYRWVGSTQREYSAGRAENITCETLDDLAIRLYS